MKFKGSFGYYNGDKMHAVWTQGTSASIEGVLYRYTKIYLVKNISTLFENDTAIKAVNLLGQITSKCNYKNTTEVSALVKSELRITIV